MTTTPYVRPERPPARKLTTLARVMRWILLVSTLLMSALALMQFLLVGMSMFESASHWADHELVGHIYGEFAFLVWIPAVLGKAGWKAIGVAFAMLVLMMAQYAFINASSGVAQALHPLNGSILLVLSIWLCGQAIAGVRSPRSTASG